MILREGTFNESLPLLAKLWPDSYHIFPIDNPLGLVAWSIEELHRADPKFYVAENSGEVVATLHIFYATPDTLCLRGISGELSTAQWQELFTLALANTHGVKKVYTVFKEPINTLVKELGFQDIAGPFWTTDWKVFLAWKYIND